MTERMVMYQAWAQCPACRDDAARCAGCPSCLGRGGFWYAQFGCEGAVQAQAPATAQAAKADIERDTKGGDHA